MPVRPTNRADVSRPKIDFIYIDSGGGHRAAAAAVDAVIRDQQRPWEVRLRNIQDLLNSIDFIQKLTGVPFQDVYNIMLRRGWTFSASQLVPVSHLAIRLSHAAQVRVLAEHWRQDPPDMVVSFIPHYNRALCESLKQVRGDVQLVTVLTDIADYPPHFWIECQGQYVICGSAHAASQARQLGVPEHHILRTSGMILHPRFYDSPVLDRREERKRLGLHPDLPTALVSFGGEGSLDAVEVAKSLDQSQPAVQLIILTGRHEAATQKLHSMHFQTPIVVQGFTTDVPYYMRLADFFIGKPGPGMISEALAMGLPVIVERNFRTLAQERYNADWILQQQVGMVVNRWSHVSQAVDELLSPERYERYRANAQALQNFAVYEIPDLLDTFLETRADDGSPAAMLSGTRAISAGEIDRGRPFETSSRHSRTLDSGRAQ
jgi:Glycosyltransferase family 28 C-terminal domain